MKALVEIIFSGLLISESLSIKIVTSGNDLDTWKRKSFEAVTPCPNPVGEYTNTVIVGNCT